MSECKPEYNGKCAFGISLGKKLTGADKYRIEKDGKVFYFANPIAKFLWQIVPDRQAKADALWKSLG
ncbi:hypothetical protein [Leptospira idonii]|uniref:YHS domain-containing protein n=1 Tax=Leptospira idonii TaxID=1193500 RepID=A0A4R9M303_9LEPT|nr:hypothetical protein [Leptospira idonii]TGN19679.1 hypothetical protein EHS15_07830 [Leptospira idonii]